MKKETEARRTAKLKYRKNSTHSLVMNFPNKDWGKVDAYCKYIQSPVATWVRKLIWQAIDSDPTFTYIPQEESPHED